MAKQYFTLDELVFAEKPANFRFKDLTGFRYEKLTVVGYAGKDRDRHCWFAQCDCGKIVKSIANNLGRHARSCGCLKTELTKSRAKHGDWQTKEYLVYMGMKRRCENPNEKRYKNYGGRGISVELTYEEFLAEVGRRPSHEHQIERIDNNKNYEKGNLRWATRKEQCNNRSSSFLVEFNGEVKTLAEIFDGSHTLKYKRAYKRIWRDGWCSECAIRENSSCCHRIKT